MKCFIDTNVFVYAFESVSSNKQKQARQLLDRVSTDAETDSVISYQIIQEFCNVLLKAENNAAVIKHDISVALAPIVQDTMSVGFYERVVDLFGESALSFYDACVVQAAIDLGCDVLYTEDLQDGQKFSQLKVVNPFK